MSDAKMPAAVQEILEIVRKYDLSIHFVMIGRERAETRIRFAKWSCFEQEETPGGSIVHFRTRKGENGERRPEKDIADSSNIARCFAEELAKAAVPAIQTWEELAARLGAEATKDDYLGAPPKRDFE